MYDVACIDMEGVLIPELWPHIAQATGIAELAITTREVPDYPSLVAFRIASLRRHGLRLVDVKALVNELAPLDGAKSFLESLRGLGLQLVLVSDAFIEMVYPLWTELGSPEIRCHRFICDEWGYVCEAHYVRSHGKHEVIAEFAAQGLSTLAVGDAFNDISMLRSANAGFLFRPSTQTAQVAKDLKVAMAYEEILSAIGYTDPETSDPSEGVRPTSNSPSPPSPNKTRDRRQKPAAIGA